MQVDREDGVEDDLVAGRPWWVQRSAEVGPDLAKLAVEVVGVEEVAVAVVGELTGDVDVSPTLML